ncbi:hypothetical protein BSKO_02023 [Bryopsis sp. KO-2023]|nr:hypothetical protein BSKO_02023 [Bryopsis sp. KO-2023]
MSSLLLQSGLLLCAVSLVWANCDVCHLRNDHTKDFATPFEEDVSEYKNCQAYKDNACCSLSTVNRIDDLYPGYRFDRCDNAKGIPKKLSAKCAQFYLDEYCFYECDVNVGKYRRHLKCGEEDEGNSWEVFQMPIKASTCDDWYKACKNDYICGTPENKSFFAELECTYEVNEDGEETGTCRKFKDVYKNGKEVCEEMWGRAFVYEEREDLAFTMQFEGKNPNNDIHVSVAFPDPCPDHDIATVKEGCEGSELHPSGALVPHDCEVCHLRNEHSLDVSKPKSQSLGKCSKYDANACCSSETGAKIEDHTLYGADYAWDRCYENKNIGEFPPKCWRWFVEEYCFYECDVSAGKYRKHALCEENSWQISKLPLKASECDQWYDDCKDTLFCTCLDKDGCRSDGVSRVPKSFFSLPSLNCTEDQCKTFGDIYDDGKDLCESLWDGSFAYERHERAAYSLIWNPAKHNGNPNSFVNTHLEFPENCPGFNGSKALCEEEEEEVEGDEEVVEQTVELKNDPENSVSSISLLAVWNVVVISALVAAIL